MPRPTPTMEWDAHEYEHKERGQDWFWAVGIISVSAAVAAIIFGNIILAILVVIGAFSLSLFINKPPSTLHIVVDEAGITRENVHYPFSTLKSFWIDIDHSHKKLILRSEKLLMPLIIVPLGEDVDAEGLHEHLSKSLEEEYHDLPLVEKILEYLGF